MNPLRAKRSRRQWLLARRRRLVRSALGRAVSPTEGGLEYGEADGRRKAENRRRTQEEGEGEGPQSPKALRTV